MFVQYLLLLSPFILAVVVVVFIAAGRAPGRTPYWVRTILGLVVLVGGVACLSKTSVPVGPDWIQTLGTMPVASGSEFEQTFTVPHKGFFYVILGDEGYYKRMFAPLARNEKSGPRARWDEVRVPWTVTESEGPVASGAGKATVRRANGAYTEEDDPYLVSPGSFEAAPGRQYLLALRVTNTVPELAGEQAVVQIRADSYLFKQAGARAAIWRLVAHALIGAGIVLLILAVVAGLRSWLAA